MTNRTPRVVCILAALLLLPLLAGCSNETWSFTAVPNVRLSLPNELGSRGPLVLVSLDEPGAAPKPAAPDSGGGAINLLTPQQIARFDPRMATLLDRLAAARTQLEEAQKHNGPQSPVVLDARNAVNEIQDAVDSAAKEFKANTRKRMADAQTSPLPPVDLSSPQTVLVGAVHRDHGKYPMTIGRSFVLFIDGAVHPGTYWLTNENSTLITYSAYSQPARTRIALSGSIKVLSVDGNKILADVAIRENWEGDESEALDHPYDPAYWQGPFKVVGRRTFIVTSKDDPALRDAGVQWVTPPKE